MEGEPKKRDDKRSEMIEKGYRKCRTLQRRTSKSRKGTCNVNKIKISRIVNENEPASTSSVPVSGR